MSHRTSTGLGPAYAAVMNRLADGKRQCDIARELEITPQRVSALVRRGRERGELPNSPPPPAIIVFAKVGVHVWVEQIDSAPAEGVGEVIGELRRYLLQPIKLLGWIWGDAEAEADLQTQGAFYEARMRDNWYHATPDLMRAIKARCKEQGVVEAQMTRHYKL